MAQTSQQKPVFETIKVQHVEVACDGGSGPLGHPRVFLHINRELGDVTCPYCSKHYVLDEHAAHGHH